MADTEKHHCLKLSHLRVDKDSADDDIVKLMVLVKPTWPCKEIVVTPLNGGYSCLMYRCYWRQEPEDSLTVRASVHHWFHKKDFEQKVVLALSERGYFPPIPAVFENGYCYEYIPGKPLASTSTDVVTITDEIHRMISKMLAQIHSVTLEGEDYSRTTMFDVTRQFLREFYPPNENRAPSTNCLIEEINMLENHLEKLGYPLVLCHGDFHPGNMVYNKDTGAVTIVDWETSKISFQPLDIAHYLISLEKINGPFMGITVNYDPEIDRPKFIRYYLESWFEITGKSPTEVTQKDVDTLTLQVMKLRLLLHLHLGVCSIGYSKVAQSDNIFSLGTELLDHYFSIKEEVLAL